MNVTPPSRARLLALLGAALTLSLALAACIIGPKHEDPASDSVPGDFDTGVSGDSTSGGDTGIGFEPEVGAGDAGADVPKTTDGDGGDAEVGDADAGDALDAPDAPDAPDGDAPSDGILDGPDGPDGADVPEVAVVPEGGAG